MSSRPIADHALLSDCRGAALVGTDAAVEWLAWPRFDSDATLARLLDDAAGHWTLDAEGCAPAGRAYLRDTMVLETRLAGPDGELVVHDALLTGAGERGHELGRASPHVLARRLRCVRGRVRLTAELAPRPGWGREAPRLRAVPGGAEIRAAGEVLTLSAPAPVEVASGRLRVRLELGEGDEAALALARGAAPPAAPGPMPPDLVSARIDDTVAAWRSWSEQHQAYEGPWRHEVHLAGRVLQALTYQPSGGVVAAPTTSLPEAVGAERNWDYRYVWLRDASMTMEALWIAACPDEAERFFRLVCESAAARLRENGDAPVVMGVASEACLEERELTHLRGWRDSRPVRAGNGARAQLQLDVLGAVLSAVYRLRDRLGDIDATTARFLAGLADAAAERWREPDQGIWEVRGEPRRHLHSALMCWAAVDRAIAMAGPLGAEDHVERWAAARDEIRDGILDEGWSERLGAFRQALGGPDELDASALLVPIVGLLPGDDPRVRGTVAAVERDLLDARGFVRRYRADDGLGGEEGAMVACTFWLAEALALGGDTAHARAVFGRAAGSANDVGLMSEQIDGRTGEQLGNFPQAYSHIGLVTAAWAIARAEGTVTEA